MTEKTDVAKALRETLISPNECDANLEPANVVDGLFAIARALQAVSKAIEGAPRERCATRASRVAPTSGPDRGRAWTARARRDSGMAGRARLADRDGPRRERADGQATTRGSSAGGARTGSAQVALDPQLPARLLHRGARG